MEADAIYRCELCGNVVSGVVANAPEIMCCGQEMTRLEPKTEKEEGKEKHVPVVSVENSKVKVTVGTVPHPMEDAHHIALIQIIKDGMVIAGRRLKPGDIPEAVFEIEDSEGISARAYCNVHGLWKS